MKNSYTKTKCSICGNEDLKVILDLGETPLADHFLTDIDEKEEYFPLKVQYCSECGLAQLADVVDDRILFKDDYGFFTGSSPSAVKHFTDYAESIVQLFPELAKGKILEIASNDGTFLKAFKDFTIFESVLGIDPADSVQEQAKKNNIPTVHQFFTLNSAKEILKYHGQKDLIIANNVMAHVDNLQDFAHAVSILLKEKGVFVAEFQYFPDLVTRGLFDNVYHEHRYYLGLKPLEQLFGTLDMHIFRVESIDTQGGSVRVFFSKCDDYVDEWQDNKITDMVFIEEESIPNVLTHLQETANKVKAELRPLIEKLNEEGKTVYAYGASAKGNTLLNWCCITPNIIPHVVDKTPYKFDKFTPGTHIIVSDQDMMELPDYYLLLVHNYTDSILSREKYFTEQGGKFIIPIPNIKII